VTDNDAELAIDIVIGIGTVRQPECCQQYNQRRGNGTGMPVTPIHHETTLRNGCAVKSSSRTSYVAYLSVRCFIYRCPLAQVLWSIEPNESGERRECKRQIDVDRHGAPDIDIPLERLKPLRAHLDVIRVGRQVPEHEPSHRIGGRRTSEAGDRIAQVDGDGDHHATGGVLHGALNRPGPPSPWAMLGAPLRKAKPRTISHGTVRVTVRACAPSRGVITPHF
jgi:hypothetical protein